MSDFSARAVCVFSFAENTRHLIKISFFFFLESNIGDSLILKKLSNGTIDQPGKGATRDDVETDSLNNYSNNVTWKGTAQQQNG